MPTITSETVTSKETINLVYNDNYTQNKISFTKKSIGLLFFAPTSQESLFSAKEPKIFIPIPRKGTQS